MDFEHGSHHTEASSGNDLEKRITEAFEVFDHGNNKTVDVREVGTILRSLGCCPTEAEIQEILVKVEDHETSSVHLAHFLPVVSQILTERKLQPASPEELLRAFHILDKEGKGYISKEYMSKLITEESIKQNYSLIYIRDILCIFQQGEPFTQEELDEMMAAAVDTDSGNILYEYYINQIMVINIKKFLKTMYDALYSLHEGYKTIKKSELIFLHAKVPVSNPEFNVYALIPPPAEKKKGLAELILLN